MALPVTDNRANANDQIAHAAQVLGRSKSRLAVFAAMHRSRQRIKSVSQLVKETGLKRQRVLDEAKHLVHKQLVTQTTRDGEVAYERDNFLYANRKKIIALAKSPKKLKAFPTKYSVKGPTIRISLAVPKKFVQTKIITINNVDPFAKARKVKNPPASISIRENTFKKGVQKLIGQAGTFKDWGGETSDLYTTRVVVNGKRKAAAFAFKGKGLTGVLTPARLGKNGDQIHRLFHEDADVFLVQYGGQIAASVMQQMAVYAQTKSISTGRTILYGVIDGQDSAALVTAYPKAFGKSKHTK